MSAYSARLERGRRQHGDRFDPSELEAVRPSIRAAYDSGERVTVRRVYDDGAVVDRRGVVSTTTGWRPAFLLMPRAGAVGSSDVLDERDDVVTFARLTRAQLAALTELHAHGRVWRTDGRYGARGVPHRPVTRRTLDALVMHGFARRAGVPWEPTVPTWADGYGRWHVTLPRRYGADAAAAIIRGELVGRQGATPVVRVYPARLHPDGVEWSE